MNIETNRLNTVRDQTVEQRNQTLGYRHQIIKHSDQTSNHWTERSSKIEEPRDVQTIEHINSFNKEIKHFNLEIKRLNGNQTIEQRKKDDI